MVINEKLLNFTTVRISLLICNEINDPFDKWKIGKRDHDFKIASNPGISIKMKKAG